MGPSIILDKSGVEAIGAHLGHVQSEYFYTVVTPILVWEVCGDIQKAKDGKCDITKVQSLARKAKPFNSIVTTDWRKLCIAELCGYRLEIAKPPYRRAIVDGAHKVPVEGGDHGIVIEQQPEADALLRWSYGEWTDEDAHYSAEWRRVTKAINLGELKRRFGPARQPIETEVELKSLVSKVMGDEKLQYFLMTLLAEEAIPNPANQKNFLKAWRGLDSTTWQAAMPYARHCLRTFLTFYLGVGSGLIGTRSTNRVDVDYLLYLPFTSIFGSGDEGTHGRLAPLLLEEDQVFVRARDFRNGLEEELERRNRLRKDNPNIDADELEPPEGSLIRELWMQTWGSFQPPPSERKIVTGDDDLEPAETIAERFRKAMDIVKANPEKYPRRPPWPG